VSALSRGSRMFSDNPCNHFVIIFQIAKTYERLA